MPLNEVATDARSHLTAKTMSQTFAVTITAKSVQGPRVTHRPFENSPIRRRPPVSLTSGQMANGS